MSFSSTVIDGARQEGDVTLPDDRCVVITIPLCIFENAGSTQVHFGKLNTTNVKRSHYAKLIQYAFDLEVIRRITRECPNAVEKVYLQRRGDYIVLFVIFALGTPENVAKVAYDIMTFNSQKMNLSEDGNAADNQPQNKKQKKGDKDLFNAPLFIAARETALARVNGAGNVNTACFPAATFNKTPDKISNYAYLVTSKEDICNLFKMMYVDAGFDPIEGYGGGGAAGGGGGAAGGGGGEASDDDAAVYGGLAGLGRGGAGRDYDNDDDDGAGGGGGGPNFQDSDSVVRFRVPARRVSQEEEETTDGAGPASVVMSVNLTWLALHSLKNPALKHLGVVDDALVTTKKLGTGNGTGTLYVVEATYHLFNSFYQSVEPCGDLLKQFEIFARVCVEHETRADEQNPPGDLTILNMFRHSEFGRNFIDRAPSVDKMREFAAMVFSRISTSDGIPEAVADMMRDVNELYRQRAGVLYSAETLTEAGAAGPAILRYANVSPVANVCLFLMEISELQDATSLHLMDLLLTISMLSTGFRPGVTKKNGAVVPDDMALNMLLGGSQGIGKSQVQSRVQARFPLMCKSANVTHSSKLVDTGVQATNDQVRGLGGCTPTQLCEAKLPDASPFLGGMGGLPATRATTRRSFRTRPRTTCWALTSTRCRPTRRTASTSTRRKWREASWSPGVCRLPRSAAVA
jgi:hypothetical protein